MEQLRKNWFLILAIIVVILLAIWKNRSNPVLNATAPQPIVTPSPKTSQAPLPKITSQPTVAASTSQPDECAGKKPFSFVEIRAELTAIQRGDNAIEIHNPKNSCLRESDQVTLFSRDKNNARQFRAVVNILKILPNQKMHVQVMERWIGEKTILPATCYQPCEQTLRDDEDLKKSNSDTVVFFFSYSPAQPPSQSLVGQAKVHVVKLEQNKNPTLALEPFAKTIAGQNVVVSFDRPLTIYDRSLRSLTLAISRMKPKSLKWFYSGLVGLDGTPIRAPLVPGYNWINGNQVRDFVRQNPGTQVWLLQGDWWKGFNEPRLPFIRVPVIPVSVNPLSYQDAFMSTPKSWQARFKMDGIQLSKPQKVILVGHSNFDWNPYFMARLLRSNHWKDVQIVRGGADELSATP